MMLDTIRRGMAGRALLSVAVAASVYLSQALADCWKCRWLKRPCDRCPVVEPSAPAKPAEPAPAPAPAPAPIPFEQFAALTPTSLALVDARGGYLDNAVIRSRMRLRFDNASNNDRPGRGEYLYPKYGVFRTLPPSNPLFDPKAGGPIVADALNAGHIDYQEYLAYFELAPTERVSGFIEMGIRALNPVLNDNTAGMGDMRVGFKYGLVVREDEHLTFQFKTYLPTGDADRGLGTDHFSLEPGLLYQRRIGERVSLEAEFKDWIPIDGTDFAGNLLQYGVGLGYDVYRSCDVYVTPIAETVAWTQLDGRKDNPHIIAGSQDASGDTIVNLKLGLRAGKGRQSVYAGYGFALTGDEWYREVFRAEYRWDF